MTTNFGCSERRTMASQPSVYNEERNLLRLRAWEQRNQETSQAKELHSENVPLFGEPYKTNKGDELSNRIQRMLGKYEDVNNPHPLTMEPLPIPTFSQSDQGQPNTDNPTKPPFHNQVPCMSTQSQKAPSSNGYSSQPTRTSTASSSLNHHGQSSTFSNASLNHSQLSHSAHQQKKSDAHSDLRERVSLFQEMCSQSPDAKPLPVLRSSDQDNIDMDTKDACDRHKHQGTTDHPSECANTLDVSTFNLKQSPKDASLPQANKGNALPSQTFPSLLSKQPSVVMTQKPTAYVRPMDGQDQVVSESPELKPSPEPYVPLPELISKSDLGKVNVLPQFLETKTNEAQCVEDILREMTRLLPPLLTAIHTPSTGEPSKSPFPAKEAERVPSCPGQTGTLMAGAAGSGQEGDPDRLESIRLEFVDGRLTTKYQRREITRQIHLKLASKRGRGKNRDSSPADPSQHIQQSSSDSFVAAHSRGVESSSSSDSESSSRSESDSESTTEEPPQCSVSISVKTEPEAPSVTHVDWQLGNWIRSSQQNSSTESQTSGQVSESSALKQPPPSQSSKLSSVEVVDPTRECKPELSSHQKEFTDGLGKPQQYSESPQDSFNQLSSKKSPSADLNSCSRNLACTTYSSKPAKTGCTEAALDVKCQEVVATRDKDPCFTDRPKVKTKSGHSKKSKDSSDAKKDSKRTSKRTSLDKRKTGSEPEAASVRYNHCPSCGVQYPNPCSCSTQSPARPDQLSPTPPLRISGSKPKSEAVCQKGTKIPHKTTHKHLEKTGHAAKSSRHPHRPQRSLVVKIDLSLLSRVPQTSSSQQDIPSDAKRSALVIEPDGGGSDASTALKLNKNSKKSIPQNVEVDKAIPRKKPRLENKNTSTSHTSVKLESFSNSAEDLGRKKAKKNPVPVQQPLAPKDNAKDSKLHKQSSVETPETSKEAGKSKDSHRHKRSRAKPTEKPHFVKKPPKSSLAVPPSSQPTGGALTNRPLLIFEDRQYPVKHYIKEAKKLKHKADAEADKLSKAFNYLDAAMYFVESGIAMEKDPQISMSSYTMFAETVELLKFVLKLKNSVDPAAPPPEKDFLALCLKCQSLLHMAMFRHKHKTALKYSKTLADHFNSSAQKTHDPSVLTSKVSDTPSPRPSVPSPASTSTSSGPGSNRSGPTVDSVGSTVGVPQAIERVAFTYINITTLFLSAHDMWEQAEELAHKGSGMLTELDTLMGPLSLTSSMSSMVRYTRQGVHWLRLDSQKVK